MNNLKPIPVASWIAGIFIEGLRDESRVIRLSAAADSTRDRPLPGALVVFWECAHFHIAVLPNFDPYFLLITSRICVRDNHCTITSTFPYE